MDERTAQFFVTVGRLCDEARTGALSVRLRLADGDEILGVPEPLPKAQQGEQLDETGYADEVTVGGVSVDLSDVVEATVMRPGG